MKKIRKYPQAEGDIANAVAYYARENPVVPERFLREIESTVVRIQEVPGSGSSRFAHELDVTELRVYSLQNFPHLVFYIEREETIDIVRVLHSSRDIYNLPLGLE